ncbi:lantibiotic dehydratase [Nocardiopsis lambiniae]|uniref:Lantibiotic dehydratase n=1 Tax=Nocardiopsis lambiniae TaxID=3075539 RepID=A0ABU2M6C6_9ACTN|nr:lantibiotic dehydratase [Nocardiopsis sp. DSM 44743]MDT0328062.1 lantibiotic dehydratase [Nocardiopsis sp. DSM 44743]
MSATSFDLVEGPYLVSRVNLYPYRPLRSDRVDLDRDLLHTLTDEEAHREFLRDRLLETLHLLTPSLEDEDDRRTALAVKRDVFNRRPPRTPLVGHPLAWRIGALGEWADSWERTRLATATLDEAHAAALVEERAELVAWARDPATDRSTALSSPDLHRAVAARAAVPADRAPDKRMRKAEPSLVRYHSRSTVKVSPYSLYTGVFFDDLGLPSSATRDGEPLRFSTVSGLRRLLVRQAARALAADPRARLEMEWVFTGGARRDGDRLTVRRRRWAPPSAGARAEAFGEEEVRLPLSGAWGTLVSALERRAARPVVLADLRDGLAAELGQPPEALLGVLVKLIDAGVLVPWAPVAEQDPEHDRRWHEAVRRLPGPVAARMAAAFDATEEVLKGFAEADGAARARSTAHLQRLWAEAVTPPGAPPADPEVASSPLVEDCHVSRGAPVPRAWTRGWAADLRRIMPLLFALDDQRVLSGALESVFVSRYGVGGRCDDLDGFAGNARAAFPMTQRLMAGDTDGAGEELRRLVAARRLAVDHLAGLARSDADEVEVDPAVVAEIAGLLPEREFRARRSLAVFGQPDGGRLVLNHLYGGRARYFSRFLSALPARARDRVAEHVRRSGPPGTPTVHMRSTLGFNANLTPPLADEELALRDEPVTGSGPATADLALVHTPDGLRLVRRRDGREIDPIYTGFLVPHALPYDEMLVAMIADSPFFSFGDTVMDLHARWETEGFTGPVPRIRSGDVTLFRRRWALETGDLAARPGESAQELHRRINVARLTRGIPDQVFVRPLQGARLGPLERAMAPKPQHVDFLSRSHTATAAKRLDHLGPSLLVEELDPCPERAGLSGPHGRHATEVFLELAVVPAAVEAARPPGEVRLVP